MIVRVKVSGAFACFTRSDARVDRVSYDVPTPSACRGILEAIYCKPIEFWYQVKKIYILKPIRHMDIMKNEVSDKGLFQKNTVNPIDVDAKRTQRHNYYLRNVAYIIEADIHIRDTYQPETPMRLREEKIRHEFERRVAKGKCFAQPYLGTRECMCFFEPVDGTEQPLKELDGLELGVMLYDIFDPENIEPLNTDKKSYHNPVKVSYFYPHIENGAIEVPDYGSDGVLKA